MLHLHRFRKRNYKNTTELGILALVLAVAFSAIETVWPLYLDFYGFSSSSIGFLSAFLVIVSFSSALFSTHVLERMHEFKVLLISIGVICLSYIILALYHEVYIFLFLSIVITVFSILRLVSFSILYRDESSDERLNEDEAFLSSIRNIGWILGPLMAGFILKLYGVTDVFLLSAFCMFLGAVILILDNLKPQRKNRVVGESIWKNILDYIERKKLHVPYLIGMGIEMWWALIYIFSPLFIINSGLGVEMVGMFLALVVIPLVILEMFVGKFSKKIGFRFFFFTGFLSLGVCALISFFVNDMRYIIFILPFASIFMAMVEPLRESYFYRQVKREEEEKFYPVYDTSAYVGSFISKFFIAALLVILPYNYAFLFTGVFMFLIAFCCSKIQD